MIRPITLIAFAAFIGSGLYLYQVKHQAQLVDREIRKVQEATAVALERAKLLRSEYELLNNPERLTILAAAYASDLKPTQPGQWSNMAEIERRLPGVGGPTAAPAPLEPTPKEDVPMATAEPAPASVVAAAIPPRPAARAAPPVAAAEPPPPATVAAVPDAAAPRPVQPPVQVAAKPPAIAAKPTPRATLAAVRVPSSAAQPARTPGSLAHAAPTLLAVQPPPALVQLAANPLPALRPAPVQSLLPRVSPPTDASVLAISTRTPDPYAAPPATPAEAVARIARGGAVDPSVPMVASALGMARTMMTLTPVSAANAGTVYPQSTLR
jgi:hypothetical protein